jgi:threonine synthase
VFAAPEGAASLVAYLELRQSGFFARNDIVVLFNTGSGYKYLDVLEPKASQKNRPPASRNIGGIIGPY